MKNSKLKVNDFSEKFKVKSPKLRKFLLIAIFFTLSLWTLHFKLLTISPAYAQSSKNTVSVTPQLTQLDLSTDEPETLLYYKNTSSTPIELSLSVEDVKELEDRNPVGILDPKEALNYKYSLSSWVTLERQTLLLNPGEERSVKVSIAKEKLSPGGHYGTILAELTQNTGKDKVKIKGVLSSLLFVRAGAGNEIEDAKVSFIAPNQIGITFPSIYSFRFQNTGNVELIPYGILEVRNQNNTLVARGIVNEESALTLPEAIRTYTITAKQTQAIILPGKYTATLSLHYGKGNKTVVIKKEFTTLGDSTFIKGAGVFLAFALVLLVALRLIIKQIQRKHATSEQ